MADFWGFAGLGLFFFGIFAGFALLVWVTKR
jgi:hypothetical protein